MDVTYLAIWLGAFGAAIAIANTIWVWFRTNRGDLKKKIDEVGASIETKIAEVKADLKGHDRRIQAVEGEVKHLPTKDDFRKLELGLTTLDGKVDTHAAELNGVSKTADRIERFLLEGGKAS